MPDADPAVKSLAKSLARDITTDIGDRHLRAAVRTRSYNRLVSLLGEIERRRAADQNRQNRTLLAAGGVIAALCLALGGSLLV
jgi:hypothetical protein